LIQIYSGEEEFILKALKKEIERLSPRMVRILGLPSSELDSGHKEARRRWNVLKSVSQRLRHAKDDLK